MISAEYYALDQSAVQSLIAIRARELDHILDRFNNMGTQAALMAGFAITTITAIDVTGHETKDAVQHFFFASSSVCVAASMHSIIMTTYLANWGPGLALRGPRGSVSRAYVAMMSERNNVEFSFSIAVVFFIMQTILAIWSLDGSRKATFDCIAGTVILGGGACATFIYLYQCKLRLHFDDSTPLDMGTPSANTGTQGAGSGGGSGGRDDGSRHEMEAPLVMAGNHPDLHTGRSASRDAADANFLAGGSVAVEGYLMKRSTRAAAGGSTSVQSALGVAAFKRRVVVVAAVVAVVAAVVAVIAAVVAVVAAVIVARCPALPCPRARTGACGAAIAGPGDQVSHALRVLVLRSFYRITNACARAAIALQPPLHAKALCVYVCVHTQKLCVRVLTALAFCPSSPSLLPLPLPAAASLCSRAPSCATGRPRRTTSGGCRRARTTSRSSSTATASSSTSAAGSAAATASRSTRCAR